MEIPGYHINREIGSGGMATVYLAVQESLGRLVAIKVIKPVLATNPAFAQRFLREGRISGQLNHPQIVKIFDVGAYQDYYSLVMEFVSGGMLKDYLGRDISLNEKIRIIKIIAGALGYAHTQGIIHRDIKPQNILFHENGDPMLVDFGIAKSRNSETALTVSGMSIGTPRYMSPEQIKGKDVDTRSDLYSLGVMFYEMLTGELPYSANDSFALAFQHVSQPIPRLPRHLAFLQPALNGLLEKQPHKRFATASEFIEALIDIEHRQGIGSQPFALPRRSSKLSRLGITGIASIMLVGVASGSLFLTNQSASKAGWPEQSQYELNLSDHSSERPAVSALQVLVE